MLAIEWRPEARNDLANIIDYIAQRNDSAALQLLQDIEDAVFKLPLQPEAYRPGRVPGTRELVVRPNYLVVYRLTPATIEIVTVMHARQQYPR